MTVTMSGDDVRSLQIRTHHLMSLDPLLGCWLLAAIDGAIGHDRGIAARAGDLSTRTAKLMATLKACFPRSLSHLVVFLDGDQPGFYVRARRLE